MGTAIETRMAITAITIINSISVKPRRDRGRRSMSLPLRIRRSIRCFLRALGVNVEQVLTAKGLRFRIVACAALAPIVGVSHRVFRYAPQKMDLLVHFAGQLHA